MSHFVTLTISVQSWRNYGKIVHDEIGVNRRREAGVRYGFFTGLLTFYKHWAFLTYPSYPSITVDSAGSTTLHHICIYIHNNFSRWTYFHNTKKSFSYPWYKNIDCIQICAHMYISMGIYGGGGDVYTVCTVSIATVTVPRGIAFSLSLKLKASTPVASPSLPRKGCKAPVEMENV